MQENHFDAIVVGGGAIGQAAAYALGKRGARTLVLEQFTFANQLGSSAGISRQFRIPYPQQYMVKLVKQSIPFWDELQALTPVTLRDKVGTLWFGDPTVHSTEGNIAEAEQALTAEGVPFDRVDVQALEGTYGFRALPSTYKGLFQPDGASIDLRATILTLLQWNRASPHVTLHDEAPVTAVHWADGAFRVRTPLGTFAAEKLVLAPGPYANGVFGLLGFEIEAIYWNMTSAYFRKTQEIQYPTWFVFQNPIANNGNQFYGFPEVDWNYPGYLRVAPDFVQQPIASPGDRTFVPNPDDLAFTSQWVRDHMSGLDPTPHFTSTCLVALNALQNKELIIDFAPNPVEHRKDIVVYATGWAAKFVPLLGRILSDLALDGKTPFDISQFCLRDSFLRRR
ncbi:MAG TPA: FAD-dependent oxidoreductase [Kofleriaceae bacterium]|jgi:glycine/D-amino acid oxidase-like deaminating enzyme